MKRNKSLAKFIALTLIALLMYEPVFSFCGFYVAKADTKLFNNKSEVILVRDGNRSTITMSNDFEGSLKDFAMVVPVPVVLKESDIRVTDRSIFETLDAYSAPRLVEYYDENPCQPVYEVLEDMAFETAVSAENFAPSMKMLEREEYSVTIEAEYQVGEYDILILSATESSGLKRWLVDNGYKIPATAEKVLAPYIKSNMKFFVVKVNLDGYYKSGTEYLSPIQISFDSDRFMLPIRLGMANSRGEQDMVVYAFTKEGRIETTNYRTVNIPTDRNIPLFVQPKFGQFYKDLFDKSYEREGRNGVFLEYAWDVSPRTAVKCDPCVSQPPIFADFKKAGVSWATDLSQNSTVFFTRLHVRYSRDKFPEDLFFQVTPNKERFQGRYILTHPASGDFSCDAGQRYLQDLEMKRKREIDELAALTGWDGNYSKSYIHEFSNQIKGDRNSIGLIPFNGNDGNGNPPNVLLLLLGVCSLVATIHWLTSLKRRRELAM